jgi:CheY-like chemotaxis protein
MHDDSAGRPPAQRALLRLLETILPDPFARERALRRALGDANLFALPADYDAMLNFVRSFLAPHLDDSERPWLVGSVLEDLEAEAEAERLGVDANSSARMAVATRIPAKLPKTEPAPDGGDSGDVDRDGASASIPKAPAVPMIDVAPRRIARVERPAVLLLDGDRFARSALARALVQARCDVNVLDGIDEAIAAIDATDAIDVVVLDVDAPGSDAVLAALCARRPEVPVVAWTNAATAVADHVARVAGITAYTVVARTARSLDVHEAIRRVLDG